MEIVDASRSNKQSIEESMEIGYNVEYKDMEFHQILAQAELRRRFRRSEFLGYGYLMGALLCATLIGLFNFDSKHDVDTVIDFSIVFLCAVACVCSYLLYQRHSRQWFSKILLQSRGPYPYARRLTLDEEGIELNDPHMVQRYGWGIVNRADKVGRYIVVFFNYPAAILVPVSAFPSEAAQAEFLSIVSAKAPKPASSHP